MVILLVHTSKGDVYFCENITEKHEFKYLPRNL